jgi:hypothetical protein
VLRRHGARGPRIVVSEVLRRRLPQRSAALGNGRALLERPAMSTDLTDPKHWRERAAAARKASGQTAHVESTRTLLWVAASYEKLAERGPRGCSSGWSPRLVDSMTTGPTILPRR